MSWPSGLGAEVWRHREETGKSLRPGCVPAVLGTRLGEEVSPRPDANLSRRLAQPSYLLVPVSSDFLPEERQLTPSSVCTKALLQLEREQGRAACLSAKNSQFHLGVLSQAEHRPSKTPRPPRPSET